MRKSRGRERSAQTCGARTDDAPTAMSDATFAAASQPPPHTLEKAASVLAAHQELLDKALKQQQARREQQRLSVQLDRQRSRRHLARGPRARHARPSNC